MSVVRQDGLELTFPGTENLSFSHVRQFATIAAGAYALKADIESNGITTREGPLLHVFDVESPSRLDVATDRLVGSRPRHQVTLPFTVSPATRAIVVQVERRPCEKFDNKIAGTLHIYSIRLERANRPE